MRPYDAVVFLHAFPMSARMWDPSRADLPRDLEALAPHFPGFGDSAPGPTSLAGFASEVLAALDREGFDRVVLVGLSMGGYVAFRLLDVASSRVAGLVLADTRAAADPEDVRDRRTAQAARVRAEGPGWLPDALLPGLLGVTTRAERPEVVDAARTMITGGNREGIARALEALRDRPDSTPMLHRLRMPAHVIVGAEDTLTPPAEAATLAAGIHGATLDVLPGAGHLSALETPAAFCRSVTSFLGRIR